MTNKKDVKKDIEIKGMHCSSCVKNIENTLMNLKGVKKVKVSLEDEKASVIFDSSKISEDDIKKAINKLGYKTDLASNSNIKQGILYGLIPHIGCIAFVLASILGATFFTQFFKPLLMSRYFFYILILISVIFATISSYFYLKKNNLISQKGIKRSWKYLATMYGTTISINLLFFLFIFPILTNVSAQNNKNNNIAYTTGSNIKISVDIPCSGHAPLIVDELKKLNGVNNVKFDFPNIFVIYYDNTKTTKQDILSLDVFKEYPATVISENDVSASTVYSSNALSVGSGSCDLNGGCGCGLKR
ncbi:MAG: copper ion binding protein [Candidatus Aenigmatarchaeota archaeon]